MPRKYFRKKRAPRRKRFGRKRRGRKLPKTTYKGRIIKVHSALPLPNKFTCKHRYVEDANIAIDPSGLIPATYSFRANSLFDPNLTGTGHQPMGFDQIMPFYNHYTVIGSRIRVTFVNTDTANVGLPQIVGIMMNGEGTPSVPNWQALAEQGNMTYSSILNSTSNSPASQVTLVKTFSARKYFGRRGILTEDDFRGTSTTNPAEMAYFHLFVAPQDGVSNTASVRCMVEIEYISVYTELRQLAQS